MTEKELLYVEDVLGHEQLFETQCKDFAGRIQDGELKNFATELSRRHKDIFNSFYGLL